MQNTEIWLYSWWWSSGEHIMAFIRNDNPGFAPNWARMCLLSNMLCSWYSKGWMALGSDISWDLFRDWNEQICPFVAGLENLAHWWLPSPLLYLVDLYALYAYTIFPRWISLRIFPHKASLQRLEECPHPMVSTITLTFASMWVGILVRKLILYLWWLSRWRVWFGYPM